jgi:hypothetical protein
MPDIGMHKEAMVLAFHFEIPNAPCQHCRRHMLVMAEHITEHYKLKGMLLEVEDEDGQLGLQPPSIEVSCANSKKELFLLFVLPYSSCNYAHITT